MARTTATAVKGVLLKDYDSAGKPDLTPFIRAAGHVVDRAVELAEAEDFDLSSALQADMECWLAAHFYCQSDKPYQSRNTGKASAVFAGKTGMYFESTNYGQTAMRLDPSGSLQAIGGAEQKVISAAWLGEEEA
mgnify:CR=1 FL=1